jgi:hypothetical protein
MPIATITTMNTLDNCSGISRVSECQGRIQVCLYIYVNIKKNIHDQQKLQPSSCATVDGRIPAPPWMVETYNEINHLSTGSGFLPSTASS